jgi:hypothetical protein
MADEYYKAAAAVQHLAQEVAGEDLHTFVEKMLRYVYGSGSLGILPLTGTQRSYLYRAPAAATLLDAGFIASTGGASDANDFRTITLEKNDMDGGSDTAFDSQGGASEAVTAQTYIPFTVVPATDTLAADEGLFAESTAAMSGEAWGLTQVFFTIRLD